MAVLLVGCFSEPEPIGDDDGTVMCIQAPCTATDDPSTSGPEPTATAGFTETSATPADSTSTSSSTSSSSSESDGSTGFTPACGDGEVNQPSEMCDSTPGCLPDCTFKDYDCNPLTDAGCIEGLRCGAIDVPLETFGCMLAGRGGPGSPCSGAPANDSGCGVGLTCLFNVNTPLCDSGNCCVEYCDLTDPGFRCSGGAVCRQFFLDSMFDGLEQLGYCGEP
jgi:hypothetical protein